MSKNGGYVIVDFKDVDIKTEGGGVVVGIYETLKSTHRKAVLVSGVTIDGTEYRDTFVNPIVNAGNYTFTAYGKIFTIANNDNVTIA